MKRLYFDTETTGFPQRTSDISRQPHICQLAAILVDGDGGEVASMNFLIRPDGWTIPDDVAAIHGISTEKAAACGIPIRVAMAAFSNLCRCADQIIAHNISFDRQLIAIECERVGQPSIMDTVEQYCTKDATTDICKLPGKFGKYKWPKLQEAHVHFFSVEFDDAHDALADVRACFRVHQAVLAMEGRGAE